MKTKLKLLAAVLLLSTLNHPQSTACAQGTAFTYQGRLNDGVNPAGGNYDLKFTLFGVNSGGSAVAGPLANSAVAVSNGLFTTTLDFGANFPGADRWLEIAVRTNGGGSFATLSPRQPLTPAPYAITAGNVASGGLSGTYGNQVTFFNNANSFSGAFIGGFSGNGAGLTGVNAATLGGFGYCSLPCYWNLTGNALTTPGVDFIGTTDNQPLEFKVNFTRALRLEPNINSPNVVAGYFGNVVSNGVYGAAILGGGDGSHPNRVDGNYGTVVGGSGNVASGDHSTAMGFLTTASGRYSTAMGGGSTAGGESAVALGASAYAKSNFSVAMGYLTTASAPNATAMGAYTTASGDSSTAMGGGTTASGIGSTAMGSSTVASGLYATAMGYFAQANHAGSFAWADGSSAIPFASTAPNQFLIRATGGVGIGTVTPRGALELRGGQQWSSVNFAPSLLVSSAGRHPAMGLLDFTGNNPWAIVNDGGELGFCQMPALGNTADSPTNRLTIRPDGSVVIGSVRATGMIRLGSEAAAALPAYPDANGMLIRRLSSPSSGVGVVIARTDTLTLERDGSNAGLLIRWQASPGGAGLCLVNATGVTATGAQVAFHNAFGNPIATGTVIIFSNALNVSHYDISFGNPFSPAHLTHVVLDRWDTDWFMTGTLTSSYNQ